MSASNYPPPYRDEESKLEEYIKSIADAGVRCILSGGAFGEMAMHFIEKVCTVNK
jgi:T-complex protein 1 subunit theta